MMQILEFDPKKEFIQSVQLNLNYWLDNLLDAPKLDQANLRRAVLYGCRYKETIDFSLKLMRNSMPLIEKRGDFNEWLEIIDRLKNPEKSLEKIDQGLLFIFQGDLEFQSNFFLAAIDSFQKAKQVGDEINNMEIVINSSIGLCQSSWGLRNFDLAKKYGEDLLNMEEDEFFQLAKIALIDNILGMISLSENKLKKATRYFQAAKRIYIKNKDKLGEMRIQNNLAIIDIAKENNKSALKRLNQAENFFSINGFDADMIKIRMSKGFMYYRMGNLISAKYIFSNAIPENWEYSATQSHIAWGDFVLGAIELTQNNHEESRIYFGKSLKYWEESNNTDMVLLTKNVIKLFSADN